MTDECTISRGTGNYTVDPVTNIATEATAKIYVGPCRVRLAAQGGDAVAGDSDTMQRQYVVSLPWDLPTPVRRADTVTVSGSDSWLSGRPLTVTHVEFGDQTTARRVTVQDLS